MNNIGIDIGGTFIKAAIVTSKGAIVASLKTPTPLLGELLPEKVVEIIDALVKKAGLSYDEIYTIGIGAPGLCDSRTGTIINCPNIDGCKNISICDYVKEKTGKNVFLDNDANCAALGEYAKSGERYDSFIFVTLGTGVGGGIVLGGKILRGINFAGGEVGHMTVVADGEKCNCGRRGCWEKYASVSALVREMKAAGYTGEVSGRIVFDELAKGNPLAKSVVDRWLKYIAEGICNLINIFQPEVVVIGGGISREGDKILLPVKEYIKKNTITGEINVKQTDVRISNLFNDAGVVGAGFLYTQN